MLKHESFRPRPPSAHKYDLGYSRMFDNHFNPRVHLKPWMAHVHTPTQHYYCEDSGLGIVETKMKKLSFLKSKHEKIKEVREKFNSFRNFEEYETILTNEILVTIEYWYSDLLSQHIGTTRHSEEKYSLFASELKRKIIAQYPIIKVIMKPLIFDHHSQSPECIYLRSRLGALEVQLVTKDNKGAMIKEVIFSKLSTRVWPNIPLVVDSLATFLPKDDVMIRVIDPNFDAGMFYQNQHNGAQQAGKAPNRLKGIHVILRPFKGFNNNNSLLDDLNDSKRMNESFQYNNTSLNQTMNRPSEGRVRPRSAISNASGKNSNLSYNGGYGGGLNTTTTMSPPKKTFAPRPQIEFQGLADDYGVVLFKKIPHNIYEIEIVENKNFMAEKRIMNVFELIDQCLPLKEEIELRSQSMCFCKVKLHEKRSPVSEATIIIGKKNPDEESKTAILKEKTIGTGLFEFLIDPGEYILSINRYGYLEKIEEIVAIQGENNYEIEMKRGEIPVLDPNEGKNPPVPAPDAKKQDPFVPRPPSGKQRYADVKKEPLHTDIPKIKPQEEEEEVYQMEKKIMPSPMNHQDHHPHPEEGAKNNKDKAKSKVKKVNFRVLNLDTEEPVFGAEIQIDEISLKGSTDHEGKIQIPISKMKEGRIEIQHQHFFGVIEDYGDEGGIDLKSLQDKIFYLIPRTSNDNEIHVRFVPGGSKRCLKLSILAEETLDLGDDGRVFAGNNGKQVLILRKLHSKVYVLYNFVEKRGVIRILGLIEDMQEFLSSADHLLLVSIRDDCEPVPLNLPVQYQNMRAGVVWDIGFFASKAFSPFLTKKDTSNNLQFYEINAFTTQKLTAATYLHEYQIILNYLHNSKSDLKTILGFKSKTRIEKNGDIFIKRETMEASMEKYGLEIDKPPHLFASALREDGYYSFRELERRFTSIQPPFSFVESKQSSIDANDGEYLYGGGRQNGK